MKNWLDRTPRTARDLLYLIAAAAVIWLVVGALPGTAGGFAAVLGALSPFAGGIALAYVLDIPTRFYAEKLFRGKRAPAIVLAYLTFIVVLAAVIGLILVFKLLPKIGRYVPSSSIAGFLFVLGIFKTVIADAPLAFASDAAAGGTAMVVTAVTNPFLGMLAGVAAKLLGL